MEKYKVELGRLGEDFAVKVLTLNDYKVIGRNVHTQAGEIDIIAECNGGSELCFAEVKTRSSDDFGRPSEAVNSEKQRRMRNSAMLYLNACETRYEFISFQVIEIYVNRIEHAF